MFVGSSHFVVGFAVPTKLLKMMVGSGGFIAGFAVPT
jgi:hypothetical protein